MSPRVFQDNADSREQVAGQVYELGCTGLRQSPRVFQDNANRHEQVAGQVYELGCTGLRQCHLVCFSADSCEQVAGQVYALGCTGLRQCHLVYFRTMLTDMSRWQARCMNSAVRGSDSVTSCVSGQC